MDELVLDRLKLEYQDVKIKYFKLRYYLEETEKNINQVDEYLLIRQYQVMMEYLTLLKLRMANYNCIVEPYPESFGENYQEFKKEYLQKEHQ